MFHRLGIFVLVIAIIAASVLASARFWVASELDTPMNVAEEGFVITVEPGSSLRKLSRKLVSDGLIVSAIPLLVESRLKGHPRIIRGDYLLMPGETPRTLLVRLEAGDILRFFITFPEGLTLVEWLGIINRHEKLEQQSISLTQVQDMIVPPTGDSLEGWFFPDTYSFTGDENGLSILKMAHQKMVTVLADEWSSRQENLPLETSYEALILASIVEKETGVPHERPTIAGVFVRRLETGMKLQTDPTVIYGLGEQFAGNLTKQHLREPGPFNTYHIQGLPPTPIANPGLDAIRAALNPGAGDAVYFVARGDGSHQFSATLAEHQKAVREFQLNRKKNYRSAPQK